MRNGYFDYDYWGWVERGHHPISVGSKINHYSGVHPLHVWIEGCAIRNVRRSLRIDAAELVQLNLIHQTVGPNA